MVDRSEHFLVLFRRQQGQELLGQDEYVLSTSNFPRWEGIIEYDGTKTSPSLSSLAMDVQIALGHHVAQCRDHQHRRRPSFQTKWYFPSILDSSKRQISFRCLEFSSPAFRTLTRNIRLRRNANVAINVPSRRSEMLSIVWNSGCCWS